MAVSNIDWECLDCGTIYRAPETAGRELSFTDARIGDGRSLPENCPECGDHSGWVKRNE
jgi:rubredoxin